MSIYSYVFCKDCHEKLWVADPDRDHFHADGPQLLRFFEKHKKHILVYDWEETEKDDYGDFEEI